VQTGLLAAGIAAVGFGLAFMAEDLGLVPEPLAASTISTGDGEIATVALADGSSVRLGPDSRLRFTGRERNRTVWLDGRAFFGVEGDSGRRFVVRTGQGEVVVHGTRFEVRSEPDEFRVMVVEGEVSVSTNEGRVKLGQSEMSRAARGEAPRKVHIADPYDQLGWMGNHLVFRATPLAQAVDEIRRHFGVTVSLERPLEQVPVTATFTDRSPQDVVLVLCEIVGATCELHPESQRFRIGSMVSGPSSARGG
jgi:transmembrane sensor